MTKFITLMLLFSTVAFADECPGVNTTQKPIIQKLEPNEIDSKVESVVQVYGWFLQNDGNVNTKISIEGAVMNGIPITPCHLEVTIEKDQLSSGDANLYAITTLQSDPFLLVVK